MKGLQYKLKTQEDGTPYPRQRWLVQMELQGDCEEDVIAVLRNFLYLAESKQTSWNSVGGGLIVSSDIDDQFTKERYQTELMEFRENSRKSKLTP